MTKELESEVQQYETLGKALLELKEDIKQMAEENGQEITEIREEIRI